MTPQPPQKPKRGVKRVKAWLDLDDKNEIIAIEMEKTSIKSITLGTWTFTPLPK